MPEDLGGFEFEYMHYGVAQPDAGIRIAFPPVGDDEINKLVYALKAKLTEPVDVPKSVSEKLRSNDVLKFPPLHADIRCPGYPSLHMRIDRYGQTAAMASWVHNLPPGARHTGVRSVGGNVTTQAVSLYLSGIDRHDDNCVISAAQQVRFSSGKPLPMSPQAYEKVKGETRPLGVQIFCQMLAWKDPSLRACFLALGGAFFGVLGVSKQTGSG